MVVPGGTGELELRYEGSWITRVLALPALVYLTGVRPRSFFNWSTIFRA